MMFMVTLPAEANLRVAINRCGYATFRDPATRETSFVRRLGSYFYPRFHLYVQIVKDHEAQLSLHIDMKQPSYQPGRAHSGVYEGPGVAAEVERLQRSIATLAGRSSV